MASLPVIDFSSFLDPKSSTKQKLCTALEIDNACREIGFFYLKNHGVPLWQVEDMLERGRQFIETASKEEKKALSRKPAGVDDGDSARGYVKNNGKKRGTHEAIDMFRPVKDLGPPYSVGCGPNHWPSTPSDFRYVSEIYTDSVLKLGNSVMSAIALALDVDEKIFMDRINKAFWNLRIVAYPGIQSDNETFSGINQHTDFGILTFLMSDPQKDSLQVRTKSGIWISADPIPGCFVVNIGDMLSKWTRGLYLSTCHRVKHNSPKTRISIPLFFDPNWDAEIFPVVPVSVDVLNEKAEILDEDGIFYKDKFVEAMNGEHGVSV